MCIMRCTDNSVKEFKYYGGRGVCVHLQWLFDPQEFAAYLDCLTGSRDPYKWMDRINNDGHYEPGNLRFITSKESATNRGNNGPVAPLYELTPELLTAANKFREGWMKKQRTTELAQLNFEPTYDAPELYEELYNALKRLTAREQYVLECRFWYNMTFGETGHALSVSRTRALQLEQTALRKLRQHI